MLSPDMSRKAALVFNSQKLLGYDPDLVSELRDVIFSMDRDSKEYNDPSSLPTKFRQMFRQLLSDKSKSKTKLKTLRERNQNGRDDS